MSAPTALLDTSVLVASLDAGQAAHKACDRVVAEGIHRIYLHALAETFSVLTGGRLGRRIAAIDASRMIEASIVPFVQIVSLSGTETLAALAGCQARGARGAAVYDLLHLMAARKAKVDALLTLDVRDYRALAKPGDPRIETP